MRKYVRLGRLFLIYFALLTMGCTTVATTAEPKTVRVYKDAGYVQCRPASGVPLTEMERPLLEAGLRVLSSTCGAYALAQVAMCDVWMGILGVFELPAGDAGAADRLGYHVLRPGPDFKTGVMCKY